MIDGLVLGRSEVWQLELVGRMNFCFTKMMLFSGYFQTPDQDLNLQIQVSFRDEQHFILPTSRLLEIPSCHQCLARLLEGWGVPDLLSPAWPSGGVAGVKAGWEPHSKGCVWFPRSLVLREQTNLWGHGLSLGLGMAEVLLPRFAPKNNKKGNKRKAASNWHVYSKFKPSF